MEVEARAHTEPTRRELGNKVRLSWELVVIVVIGLLLEELLRYEYRRGRPWGPEEWRASSMGHACPAYAQTASKKLADFVEHRRWKAFSQCPVVNSCQCGI